MGFFKTSNPEKRLAAELSAALAARDKLAKSIESAEASVVQCHKAAKRLTRDDGDGSALEGSETQLRRARDHLDLLKESLVDAEREIADLERQQAEVVDRKQRKSTVAEIADIEKAIDRDVAAFSIAALALAKTCERAAPIVVDARGVAVFAETSVPMVADAVALVLSLLRSHASDVLNGTASATLSTPEAAPAPVAGPPKPETRTICNATSCLDARRDDPSPSSGLAGRPAGRSRRTSARKRRGAASRCIRGATTRQQRQTLQRAPPARRLRLSGRWRCEVEGRRGDGSRGPACRTAADQVATP